MHLLSETPTTLRGFFAIAEEADRVRQADAAIAAEKRQLEQRQLFEKTATEILERLPEFDGWTSTDPGPNTYSYNRYDDWPEVVFERYFEPEDLTVRVGARGWGDGVALLTHSEHGWSAPHQHIALGNDWTPQHRLVEIALIIREAAEFAKRRYDASVAQVERPAEVPTPEPPCSHAWHAVLALECGRCGTVEVEPPTRVVYDE
jgi:hypothetical protein